ncbi:MFS sugar transporter-like protein [Pleurostoma richardsiae]|uniref:MFS sugar transporter-like protein n=1 Tax=Pleurostoma richardsiae TaxID=41990 RepID=A0AA38VNK2_9PEZI|nr:MFS sugar transporter-like protein [Pleurostoma richardsiae]
METHERRYVSSLVPRSPIVLTALIIGASAITSTTLGYDGSMTNGLNILPQYNDYFHLETATRSLLTSAIWIGGALSTPFGGYISDRWGRKHGMFWAAIISLVGVILQTAAQNIAMFVIGRMVIGFGTTMSKVATPTYVSETTPMRWRAFALGIFYDFWYVGGLIAAGVTYGTFQLSGTWAWRAPSILQGLPSIFCLAILPFVPESPRWLIYQDRLEDGLEVLAITSGGGSRAHPVVVTEFNEITDTIRFEKEAGTKKDWVEPFRTPVNRKRMSLALSVAVIGSVSGNTVISYYLGDMLDQAGIRDTTEQLQVNIVLSVFCLIVSLLGTSLAERMGRRFLAIGSTAGMVIFMFLVGALTRFYTSGGNLSGSYATVAAIFLFQGSYSFGWTPLSVMYPPEVLHYSIRASGMAIYTLSIALMGIFTTYVFPFALDGIGWKTYMVFGSWDLLELAYVAMFWIETRGKTLEEVDALIDVSHTDAPDLATVLSGKVQVLTGLESEVERHTAGTRRINKDTA